MEDEKKESHVLLPRAALTTDDCINGYPVVASIAVPVRNGYRDTRVVIVQRGGTTDKTLHPFVVAHHVYGAKEWLNGIYCRDLAEAWTAMTGVLQREMPFEPETAAK